MLSFDIRTVKTVKPKWCISFELMSQLEPQYSPIKRIELRLPRARKLVNAYEQNS